MSSKLDQSLESIVAANKPQPRARGASRPAPSNGSQATTTNGSTAASARSHPLSRAGGPQSTARPSIPRHHPYAAPMQYMPPGNVHQQWTHDMYRGVPTPIAPVAPAVVEAPKVVSDTVYLNNLPAHVTSDDLRDIFGPVGAISSLNLFFDQNGRSLGTAQIVFRSAAHAEKVVQEFDQAAVDGQTISVKLIGGTVVSKPVVQKTAAAVVHVPVPVPMPQPQPMYAPSASYGMGAMGRYGGGGAGRFPSGGNARPSGGVGGPLRSSAPRGGAGGASGAGGARSRAAPKPVTAADLDAELDAYHAAAASKAASAQSGDAAAAASETKAEESS